ncbi:hypothetical protein CFOL_v3_31543 [Cephalotus follicularis]|uniref:Retrovirus-related Pol polyprotein from transposon TNT 1-94-like beta-barrel domain-containing protein n=1 Tax=Cephalotus follicularis TaxID=3775 RepID=A0A1Q3D6L3_CEPFO|nr:hypothetical protein CFOL_v3_31543 [Cephalotus follicularis]
MTPHRDWFCEYDKFDGGDVMLGDNTPVKIIGHGKVRLKMSDGSVRTLPGVMHIPTMSKNLLSVGPMADAGVTFSCDKLVDQLSLHEEFDMVLCINCLEIP